MSRNLIQILFNNFKKSLRKAPPATPVGEDHLGNKYFEFTPDEYYSSRRKKRTVKPVDTSIDYELPFEWEAWLRWKRRDPPTQQEIDERILRQAQTAANVHRLNHGHSKHNPDQSEFPKFERYSSQPGTGGIRKKDTIEE